LKELSAADDLSFCFGSEGGFSEAEIQLARDHGCQIIALGPRVLRAETAPIAVLGAAQTLWGDW
jgi:16S rRNA (uracil1498-N3)-methyltransferase